MPKILTQSLSESLVVPKVANPRVPLSAEQVEEMVALGVVRKVPLSNGMFALVDSADWPAVSGYKWHQCQVRPNKSARYVFRNHGKPVRTTLKLHRILMNAQLGQIVDHINGDALDNRRANLRFVTKNQNQWAARKRTPRSSKYKGAFWDTGRKRWRSAISFNRKVLPLGYFLTELEAALAYDRAAKQYHGDFAIVNFP